MLKTGINLIKTFQTQTSELRNLIYSDHNSTLVLTSVKVIMIIVATNFLLHCAINWISPDVFTVTRFLAFPIAFLALPWIQRKCNLKIDTKETFQLQQLSPLVVAPQLHRMKQATRSSVNKFRLICTCWQLKANFATTLRVCQDWLNEMVISNVCKRRERRRECVRKPVGEWTTYA